MRDCFGALAIYGEDPPDTPFLCYHGSVGRNIGMGGEIEISYGRCGDPWKDYDAYVLLCTCLYS